MGVVNLKWRDAMATTNQYFDKDERATGWPDAMKPDQIAFLQRPYKYGDTQQRRRKNALLTGIESDCKSDNLPHSVRSKDVITDWRIIFTGYRLTNSFIGGDRTEATFRHDPVYTAKDFVYVSATDFAAWLAAQGEPPSEHIAAWFEAVGAGAAQAEPVTEGDSTPTAKSNDDRNLCWLNRYETEERTAKRGAYNRTAAHFGVESSTLRKAVDKARNQRTARNRDGIKAVRKRGTASMFDGLGTTVKDGKRTTNNQR